MRTINQYVIEKKRKIKIYSRTVNVDTSLIQARWTTEMAQDIFAYHHIDVVGELTRILTEEIDRTILNNLMDNNSLHQ